MKSILSLVKIVLPGLLVTFAIAVSTGFLSHLVSRIPNLFLDPLLFGLLLGLLVRWLIGEKFVFWPGFGFAQDVFIPLGILLYATQVRWNVFSYSAVKEFFFPMVLAFTIYYLFLVLPAARFKLKKSAALLIWASLSLVGPIAVVLLAPALETSDEETSLSLMLAAFATLLMLTLLPLTVSLFGFGISALGTLSTLSLPLLIPVNPATAGMPLAIQSATLLFGIKVALLGPIALVLYITHKSTHNVTEKLPVVTITGFIAIGVLFTFLPTLTAYSERIYPYSQFALTLAMVAVGLSTNLRHLITDKNKTVKIYLLLTMGACLTAFLLESLCIRFL